MEDLEKEDIDREMRNVVVAAVVAAAAAAVAVVAVATQTPLLRFRQPRLRLRTTAPRLSFQR